MIGVLLTSTCWYHGVDQPTFADRVEELAFNIQSLKQHIPEPFELIVADNSPVDFVPTEKILALCPERTLFVRSTHNPGKTVGEAVMIRDGVHLSYARGHRWLLKLTGRYRLDEGWRIEPSLALLEEQGKSLYVQLIGKSMKEMPWARNHPLYEANKANDRPLTGVASQAFIVDPRSLVQSGALEEDFLYRPIEWVNYEQTLWHAVRDLNLLHWPSLPINGFVGNRRDNQPVKAMLAGVTNRLFETTENYASLDHIDISPLIED